MPTNLSNISQPWKLIFQKFVFLKVVQKLKAHRKMTYSDIFLILQLKTPQKETNAHKY